VLSCGALIHFDPNVALAYKTWDIIAMIWCSCKIL